MSTYIPDYRNDGLDLTLSLDGRPRTLFIITDRGATSGTVEKKLAIR